MNKRDLAAAFKRELKDEEWDAISFFRKLNKNTNKETYVYTILKWSDDQKMETTELGCKFIILEKTAVNTAEVYEAVLGDPLHILCSYIKGGVEGIFIRKCEKGIKLMDSLMALDKFEINKKDFKNNAEVKLV